MRRLVLALLLLAPMSDLLAQAAGRIREWRHSTRQFAWDEFKFEPDHWQGQAFDAWDSGDPRARRIALQACAGPGKTAVLAICGWQFLSTQGDKDHHPVGYALSVTGDNLRDNLWKELAVWRNRSTFLQTAFEWTAEKVFARDHPATWWLKARTWSKTADTEAQGRTLSGLHSRYIAYLIDESGDIGPPVQRSAEQGLSNCVWGKIMQAGNPTSHDGMLYDAVANQSHKWTVIRITGDPDDANRSPRIDIDWAREQIELYGRENPWVMAYILGRFPPSSLNALLGPDEVRDAMQRHLREDQYNFSQKRLGIDVARFGDDRTIIFPRQGLAAFTPTVLRGQRTNVIASRVATIKQEFGSEMEFIDSTGGWGAGVEDAALLAGIAIIPVDFSANADEPKRYYNKRSEMHFRAAEWVKTKGGALPFIEEMVAEAAAPRYWFDGGKLRVEEKAQIKKRIGRSPDYWDSLLTTFALVEMPAGSVAGAGQRNRNNLADMDYNPWSKAEDAA